MGKGTSSHDPSKGFDAHEKERILFQAKKTTAEQRFRWLEEALKLFSAQIQQARLAQPKRYF